MQWGKTEIDQDRGEGQKGRTEIDQEKKDCPLGPRHYFTATYLHGLGRYRPGMKEQFMMT